MPSGSKPGERRGGRQRGTPNKKTLIKNAVFLAAATDPNRSPLDFMLALMRDPQVSLDLRIEVATSAAFLVHPRPRASQRSQPHPMEMRRRRLVVPDGEKPPAPSGEESAIPSKAKSETCTIVPGPEGRSSDDLSPLDFLLAVMRDPEAAPQQRVRAAQVAARYKHRPPEKPVTPVEDEFGFKIDPEVAKAVWDIRREPGFRDSQKRDIWVREHIEGIECPDGYNGHALEKDKKRLSELNERGRKLTPEEIAEEAYLITRCEVYRATPKHQAWCRISKLESRRAGWTKLTAAELSELDDLRAQFPTVARDLEGEDWTANFMADFIVPIGFLLDKRREVRQGGVEMSDEELLSIEGGKWRSCHRISMKNRNQK